VHGYAPPVIMHGSELGEGASIAVDGSTFGDL